MAPFVEGCRASRWATAKRYGTMARTRRRRGTSERRGGPGHQAARGRTPPRRGMANLKRAGPVGATTPKLLKFSPQSLGAVGGGTRIPISIPIVLVELADHLLQVRLREPRVD